MLTWFCHFLNFNDLSGITQFLALKSQSFSNDLQDFDRVTARHFNKPVKNIRTINTALIENMEAGN